MILSALVQAFARGERGKPEDALVVVWRVAILKGEKIDGLGA